MNIWNILRRCCSPIQQRFVVATLVVTGLALQYIHRLAFNLAITVITHRQNTTKEYSSELCTYNKTSEEETTKQNLHAEFYWNSLEQAIATGAFYIGYILSHVPGGVLSDLYGPKRVLGYGVVLSAICSLLTPEAARVNVYMVILVRIVMGFAQGPVFPALATFNARWSLPNERAFMSAFMSTGVVFGAITSNALTGFLLSKMSKWALVFYIYGVITMVWYILWYLFAHDTPSKHPFIGEREVQRLNEALQSEISGDAKKQKIPYLAILRSKPVWAMILAGCGHDWAFYIVVSLMPQYMSYVLHFSIVENGLINCLPYITMVMVSLSTAKLAELIIVKGWMSKTTQCKLWLLICNMMPCVFFIAASYVGCHRAWAVVFFTLSMGIMGMTYSCIRVVHVDMSPNFAGLLMALMNGFGSICGFLGPPIFAFFTGDEQSVSKWREAFYLSTVLVAICTLVFLIWGTSVTQPWNSPATSSSPENVAGTATTGPSKPEKNEAKQE